MIPAFKKLGIKVKLAVLLGVIAGAIFIGGRVGERDLGVIVLRPTLEERTPDGNLYTPSTQSALRTHSWLEDVRELRMKASRSDVGTIVLKEDGGDNLIKIKNLPLRHLAARLHYEAGSPPDEFDAYNLMLTEYSRNSLSVPQGSPGDDMSHYQTPQRKDQAALVANSPIQTVEDFKFVPNREYLPLRVSVTNNCLAPGLWELSATDRSGEIYHSWFNMPQDYYYGLVAKVNGLKKPFVKKALQWHEEEIKLDLARLRSPRDEFGTATIAVIDEEVGFSTQDSRRKMQKRYAMCAGPDGPVAPERLSDLHKSPVHMSDFVEPGFYKQEEPKVFDFAFLAAPQAVKIRSVSPKTSYSFDLSKTAKRNAGRTYLEFDIALPDGERLVIGNLPLEFLVKQEDFILHGFGVGILDSSGLAERRRFLIEAGPHPSFAYLAKERSDGLYGVNTHARGLEQIFIRSHPDAPEPHWELTIASFERIVNLAKYRVAMPESLVAQQQEHSRTYISPLFFSYRDDNVN